MSAFERITPVTGAPCWVNLMTHDLPAAQSFYASVMDWDFRDSDLGSDFSVATAHGKPVAGIGSRCPCIGPPTVWTPYFAVKHADETANRVKERGATLANGPLDLGKGRAALATDRDGAVFGFWEGPALAWSVGYGSAPARLDLQTHDAFEAAGFYTAVLGWARPPGGCMVDYAQDHVFVQVGGRTVVTLRGGGVESAPDPRIRPRWIVDFHVPDIERTAAAATAAGGEVSPIASSHAGSPKAASVIRDPDGGLFTVSEV
ncbi:MULTISPECIES: VOC family protein [unclassified Streptomyces]|uniref:VOC family protein n=1 Tax=unclassified Streptomyces TaxID=2593676 RepID=UPI00224D72DC|nr:MULTISPECIES: VOC family protein [unclassified Streptomyces]WSP53411.1 VOC family protein [Streptomyces sp. NBC_01241]WSU25917.1 VOC family protein [Streptomyces sp. NBC_01108]MCX4784781.1 VOC family protein [Streptomyces sp. NBC_01221]MCX4799261.1 VOC family protein [Streptomyces sp. NBC_01242]WSJ40444.1 VOC family protein [Streptomyces sp. NBC_01321]